MRVCYRFIIGTFIVALAVACSQVEYEFDRKRSPLGEADLIVTVTEPFMPHGKHTITVYVAQVDEPAQMLLETKMENDGVPFTKKNIGLRWTSPTQALVCLRPTDLADSAIVVQLGSPPTAELRDGC